MKKIVLSLFFIASSIFAVEVKPFVGLDIASIDANVEGRVSMEGVNASKNIDFKDITVILKAGMILEKNHRLYFSYINTSDTIEGTKADYSLPAINYDYLIKHDRLNGFMPYVGIHIGYGKTDFGTDGLVNESSVDYGFQVGVLKDITENISLELGYKFTFIDAESSISGTVLGVATTVTYENKDTRALFFGVNYKF